jgi:hypothetical protein
LVRFIGVTGHDLIVAKQHRRALERFDFDSILLPYNFMLMQNAAYAAEFEEVIAMCQARNVAVQTIKSIARGAWNGERTAATWYEPLTEQAAIDRAVHWVLGRPGVFLNSVGDIQLLPKVLDAASRYVSRPTDDEMQTELERTGITPLFV